MFLFLLFFIENHQFFIIKMIEHDTKWELIILIPMSTCYSMRYDDSLYAYTTRTGFISIDVVCLCVLCFKIFFLGKIGLIARERNMHGFDSLYLPIICIRRNDPLTHPVYCFFSRHTVVLLC